MPIYLTVDNRAETTLYLKQRYVGHDRAVKAGYHSLANGSRDSCHHTHLKWHRNILKINIYSMHQSLGLVAVITKRNREPDGPTLDRNRLQMNSVLLHCQPLCIAINIDCLAFVHKLCQVRKLLPLYLYIFLKPLNRSAVILVICVP